MKAVSQASSARTVIQTRRERKRVEEDNTWPMDAHQLEARKSAALLPSR